jgi:hypothetical protein
VKSARNANSRTEDGKNDGWKEEEEEEEMGVWAMNDERHEVVVKAKDIAGCMYKGLYLMAAR